MASPRTIFACICVSLGCSHARDAGEDRLSTLPTVSATKAADETGDSIREDDAEDSEGRLRWNGALGPLLLGQPSSSLGRTIEVVPTQEDERVYACVRDPGSMSLWECDDLRELLSTLAERQSEYDSVVVKIGKGLKRPAEAGKAVCEFAVERRKGVVFIHGRGLVFEGEERNWATIELQPTLTARSNE